MHRMVFIVAVNSKQYVRHTKRIPFTGSCELWRQFWFSQRERETEIQIHFSNIVNNRLKLNNLLLIVCCFRREHSVCLLPFKLEEEEKKENCEDVLVLVKSNKDMIAWR